MPTAAVVEVEVHFGSALAKLVVDNDASLVVRRGRGRPRPAEELAAPLGSLSMRLVVLPPDKPQSTAVWSVRTAASRRGSCFQRVCGPRRPSPPASRGAARVGELLAMESAELAALPGCRRRPVAASSCAPAATASFAPPASTTRCRLIRRVAGRRAPHAWSPRHGPAVPTSADNWRR